MDQAQQSSANPGWTGPGEPSWRRVLLQRPKRVLTLLLGGQPRHAWQMTRATLADGWHYLGPGGYDAACPCCGWQGAAFLAHAGQTVAYRSICPSCGSRSRHRGLVLRMAELLEGAPTGPMLVFAPEAVLLRQLSVLGRAVETTDAFSVDVDHPGEDIQALGFTDASYAALMCNHVLEHVADDEAAMAECARVLVPGGVALFTIPGDYDEQATVEFAEPNGNGHHRHYGMDVVGKLERHFRTVEAIELGNALPPRHGIAPLDYVFRCVR